MCDGERRLDKLDAEGSLTHGWKDGYRLGLTCDGRSTTTLGGGWRRRLGFEEFRIRVYLGEMMNSVDPI